MHVGGQRARCRRQNLGADLARSRSINCWRSMKKSLRLCVRAYRLSAACKWPVATCGGGWGGSPAPWGKGSAGARVSAMALGGEERAVPPLYRAVVEAGARSGRLTVALEGLAEYVRGYSEARTAIGLALWYPLLVLALAYGLFVGLVSLAVPRYVGAFESLGVAVPAPLRLLSGCRCDSSLLVAHRAGPAIHSADRVDSIRYGGAVSVTFVGLAPHFSLDEVDTRQLRDRQLFRAAGALARARCPLSGGSGSGGRVDRQPQADSGRAGLAESITRGEPPATALGASIAARFCPCYAGCWRSAKRRAQWWRRCIRSQRPTANAPVFKPTSSPFSCP